LVGKKKDNNGYYTFNKCLLKIKDNYPSFIENESVFGNWGMGTEGEGKAGGSIETMNTIR